jgi:hypothetical protein
MKPKNFQNGATVRIKSNAGEVGVPAFDRGTVGELLNVTEDSKTGELSGLANGWLVHPEHVSLIERAPAPTPVTVAEPELTPGFYVDGDGDLWIVVNIESGVRVVNIVSAADISSNEIRRTEFEDGDLTQEFISRWTKRDWRPSWWPLRKVADLPKT